MKNKKSIPIQYIKWAYVERRDLIKRMLEGKASKEDFLIGFLRHTPAVVSYGPAGLNASIKGIGFVVKEKYLYETTEALEKFIDKGGDIKEAIKILLKYIYVKDYMEKIDFTKLSTIELARKHTWINIQSNPIATILFFMPPLTTYEVRCKATIHVNDIYWRYVNAVHDVFHAAPYSEKRDWSKRPVYIFEIQEIYDNDPRKMGEKIY